MIEHTPEISTERKAMLEIAKELNVDIETVEKVIKVFMGFVRFRMSKIPYKTLETFDKIKTNFLIPGLGKLVVRNKKHRKYYEQKGRELKNSQCKGDV